MADIFLSYQKRDRTLAERMAAALRSQGFSVWWDEGLTPRETWDRTIEREISAASHVLVLWTRNSVESDWVRIEANYARTRTPSKLVQARFDGVAIPIAFSLIQFIELQRRVLDRGTNWPRLIEWLRFESPVPKGGIARVSHNAALQRLMRRLRGRNGVFLSLLAGVVLEILVGFPWFLLTRPLPGDYSDVPLHVIPAMPFLFGVPYVIINWNGPGRWTRAAFFIGVIGAAASSATILGLASQNSGQPVWPIFGTIAGAAGSAICFGLGMYLGCLRKDRLALLWAALAFVGLTAIGAITLYVAPGEIIAMFPFATIVLIPWQAAFAFALSRLVTLPQQGASEAITRPASSAADSPR